MADADKTADTPAEREITRAEVAEHNTEESCWLIIHGEVYDVTPYLDDHPGSSEPLVRNAGTDATDEFEEQMHSAAAKRIMKKYKIGVLPENERAAAAKAAEGDGACVIA